MPKICVSRLCLCCLSILYGVSPDLLGRYKSRASFGFLNRSSQMRRYLPLTAIWTGVSPRWDKQTRVKTGSSEACERRAFIEWLFFKRTSCILIRAKVKILEVKNGFVYKSLTYFYITTLICYSPTSQNLIIEFHSLHRFLVNPYGPDQISA